MMVRTTYRRLRSHIVARVNAILPPRYIDLGAGNHAAQIGWWAPDRNTGTTLTRDSVFPLLLESIFFAYASLFLEMVDDATARNVLREVCEALRPGSVLRVVCINHAVFVERYLAGDAPYFRKMIGSHNLSTWPGQSVPADLEHLFAARIGSIHNIDHIIVESAADEDVDAKPAARVMFPPHMKLASRGYYCGPAPELTTRDIRTNVRYMPVNVFVAWILAVNERSAVLPPGIDRSWPKNQWDFEKLQTMALAVGFRRVEKRVYGDTSAGLLSRKNREKANHRGYCNYFNLVK